jgi:hypothetical protein
MPIRRARTHGSLKVRKVWLTLLGILTQIVQTWAGLPGGPTQLIPQRTEGGPDLLISQPLALFIEEEGAALSFGKSLGPGQPIGV